MQAYHNQIFVLGASWGKDNVTDKIRQFVASGTQFRPDIETFGDNWYGVQKFLTVVFQRNGGYPEVASWKESKDTINLLNIPYKGHTHVHQPSGALRILGASWGGADVTSAVAGKTHGDTVEVEARHEVLGDPCPGNPKALTVVYQDGTGLHTTVQAEGHALKLNGVGGHSYTPQIAVLGASWGKDNVTDKIRQYAQSGTQFRPDIETFGDNWYGVQKFLTVVFQRAGGIPEVVFFKESKDVINLTQIPYKGTTFHGNAGKLRILGATFGNADVTNAVISKTQGDHLEVEARHEVLGDPCPGNPKALTVVYQDGTGVHTTVVAEGQALKLHGH